MLLLFPKNKVLFFAFLKKIYCATEIWHLASIAEKLDHS